MLQGLQVGQDLSQLFLLDSFSFQESLAGSEWCLILRRGEKKERKEEGKRRQREKEDNLYPTERGKKEKQLTKFTDQT